LRRVIRIAIVVAWIVWLGVFLFLLIGLGVVRLRAPLGPESNPMPPLHEIASFEDGLLDSKLGDVRFEVPRDHWEKIFGAMQPARDDREPAKWVFFADLKLTLKDGKEFKADLYKLSDPVGAFSCGETRDHWTYYRGGNSMDLMNAVNAAHAASTNRESDRN
jgi:hypothetical protein